MWDGKEVTAKELYEMVDNWRVLAAPQGPNRAPYYEPFISLKHNDILSCGRVARAYMDGDTLKLDGTDIPVAVGIMRNSGQLHSPSIEFWEPGDFVMPDGTTNKTPVLKCVTLLGGDAPAVKGLGPLPVATFSSHGPTRRFAARNFMDRAAKIAALQAAGVDVSKITDAVPDEFLDALIAWVQAQAAGNGGNAAAVVPDANPATMSAGTPAAVVPAATPTPAATGTPGVTVPGSPGQPQSITLKFADGQTAQLMIPRGASVVGTAAPAVPPEVTAWMNQTSAAIAGLAGRQNNIDATNAARLLDLKRQKIRAFCDRMTEPTVAKMQPAQVPVLSEVWEKLDDTKARKFSDGKTNGTELDEALSKYEATAPKLPRQFSDKIAQPHPGQGNNSGTGPLTPEARRELLSSTPTGRAILAKEAAAARTGAKA